VLGLKVPANQTTQAIHNRLRVHSALEGTKWHPKSWRARWKRMDGNIMSKLVFIYQPRGPWDMGKPRKNGKNNNIGF